MRRPPQLAFPRLFISKANLVARGSTLIKSSRGDLPPGLLLTTDPMTSASVLECASAGTGCDVSEHPNRRSRIAFVTGTRALHYHLHNIYWCTTRALHPYHHPKALDYVCISRSKRCHLHICAMDDIHSSSTYHSINVHAHSSTESVMEASRARF